MAQIFGKLKDLMLGGYDEEYEEYEEEYEPTSVTENQYTTLRDIKKDNKTEYHSNNKKNSNVYPINENIKMKIVILQPTCYEDAQQICDQVKSKKPVVVNLEQVEYPIAQRIMDFLSGTCYSLEGSIQRVANNIFVIAPENVEISGEFKEEIKSRSSVVFPWANSK